METNFHGYVVRLFDARSGQVYTGLYHEWIDNSIEDDSYLK